VEISFSCFIYTVSSTEFPSSEIKTEADGYDITECSQDDKPTAGTFGFDCNCSVFKIGCWSMTRDHSNSQFHNRDIFVISLLDIATPLVCPIVRKWLIEHTHYTVNFTWQPH